MPKPLPSVHHHDGTEYRTTQLPASEEQTVLWEDGWIGILVFHVQ